MIYLHGTVCCGEFRANQPTGYNRWMDGQQSQFGEQVVSASTIYYQLCPPDSYRDEAPPNDADTVEMNRLRGLAIVQACETEAMLGQILRHLSPSADTNRPAGILLHEVRLALANLPGIRCTDTLDLIHQAIKRRNRAVHDTVTIGSTWAPFSKSDGEWVSVISLLGLELCDEADLRSDLVLQQKATVAVVHLLVALERRTTQSDT